MNSYNSKKVIFTSWWFARNPSPPPPPAPPPPPPRPPIHFVIPEVTMECGYNLEATTCRRPRHVTPRLPYYLCHFLQALRSRFLRSKTRGYCCVLLFSAMMETDLPPGLQSECSRRDEVSLIWPFEEWADHVPHLASLKLSYDLDLLYFNTFFGFIISFWTRTFPKYNQTINVKLNTE